MDSTEQEELERLTQAFDRCEEVERFMKDHRLARCFLKRACYLAWQRPVRLLEEALQLHDAACGVNARTPLRDRICHLTSEAKREFRRALTVDIVKAVMVLVCVLIVLWPTLSEAVSRITKDHPLGVSPPTDVPPATIAFTITCSLPPVHIVKAGEPITLSAVNAVFIEPNVTPEDWDALTGTLLKLPGEDRRFSYAPSGDGLDMVTFIFVTNKNTGSVVTKVIPITVVSGKYGLCYP